GRRAWHRHLRPDRRLDFGPVARRQRRRPLIESAEKNLRIGRRRLMHATAALAGAEWLGPRQGFAVGKGVEPLTPGIKLTAQLGKNFTAEDLQFVKQVGIEWVSMSSEKTLATAETFIEMKQKVEAEGLKVWNIGNFNVHNMEEVTLGLSGR